MNGVHKSLLVRTTRLPPEANRRRGVLVLAALLLPLGITLAATTGRIETAGAADEPMRMASDALIAKVRAATAQYQTVAAALSAGYIKGTPCVSGPDTGAMGIHYVHLDWIENAVLDVDKPSALIYEPQADGSMSLVGVEYLVFAQQWDSSNSSPPALEGNLLNYIAAPNRYGLPAIYEIHVWAWRANPLGSNADWNTHVTCDYLPTG